MVVCAFYVCVCWVSCVFLPLPSARKKFKRNPPRGVAVSLCRLHVLQDGTCSLWRTNFDPASLANKELKGPRLGFVHLFFWGLGICHGKKTTAPGDSKIQHVFWLEFLVHWKKNSSLVGWFSSWPFLGWWVQHDLQWSGILKGHGLKITWRGFFKTSQQRRAAKT